MVSALQGQQVTDKSGWSWNLEAERSPLKLQAGNRESEWSGDGRRFWKFKVCPQRCTYSSKATLLKPSKLPPTIDHLNCWYYGGHLIQITQELWQSMVLIEKRHMDNFLGPAAVILVKPSGYMSLYNVFFRIWELLRWSNHWNSQTSTIIPWVLEFYASDCFVVCV